MTLASLLRRTKTGSAAAVVYRPAPQVSRASLAGEDRAMLLDGRRGGRYHLLNEFGAKIWDGVAAGVPLATIVDAAAAEYDAPREVVESDAREFVAGLLESKLLVAS